MTILATINRPRVFPTSAGKKRRITRCRESKRQVQKARQSAFSPRENQIRVRIARMFPSASPSRKRNVGVRGRRSGRVDRGERERTRRDEREREGERDKESRGREPRGRQGKRRGARKRERERQGGGRESEMALDCRYQTKKPVKHDDGRLHERPYGAPYITFITAVLIFIFHIYISRPP